MDIAAAYDITAPLDAPTRRMFAAQAELLTTADTIGHVKLANMLKVCAEALPTHPDPIVLCVNNHGRLWFAIEKAADVPDGPTATEIHIAALAFDAAANLLRGRQ